MVQSFDGLDRVTRVERTDALGSSDPGVVLREYYAGGQVHRQTNGLGVITTIVLDGMNRVIETSATVNGETLTTAAVYDGNSNVLSSTDRRGVATLNTYDALNRLTELEVRCCTARSKSLTSLMPVAESPGAVRIGHPESGHLVEYLAPNSVFNSLPRQRSSPHLRPDDRFVTIDCVLHHASLGAA